MIVKESRRHHYIPQFILRNFCFDKENNLKYYDYINKSISIKNTKDIFMEKDLYRDEINHNDNPTEIEKSFSKYESEVSLIIKEIIVKKDILLSVQDYNSLLLFFALLSFRSISASNQFSINNTDYLQYCQNNENVNDMWKRNLGHLTNCRSLDEVLKSPNIDEPIKIFMTRDIFGLFGKYIVVLERRGNEDFCLGDAYPCIITGGELNITMYDYYPISPNKIILLASNGVDKVPDSVKIFKNSNLSKPIQIGNKIKLHFTKIYNNEVESINKAIISNSKIGICFKDESRVPSLFIDFNEKNFN